VPDDRERDQNNDDDEEDGAIEQGAKSLGRLSISTMRNDTAGHNGERKLTRPPRHSIAASFCPWGSFKSHSPAIIDMMIMITLYLVFFLLALLIDRSLDTTASAWTI
jgi:hypothetical protein